MVTRMFRDKISKTVEVYIDDMAVISKDFEEHVQNLAEVFEILSHQNLRLNASKCTFEVGSRKFHEYMITCNGVKVNTDQTRAIQQLSPPSNLKEVQKLIGMITALKQ